MSHPGPRTRFEAPVAAVIPIVTTLSVAAMLTARPELIGHHASVPVVIELERHAHQGQCRRRDAAVDSRSVREIQPRRPAVPRDLPPIRDVPRRRHDRDREGRRLSTRTDDGAAVRLLDEHRCGHERNRCRSGSCRCRRPVDRDYWRPSSVLPGPSSGHRRGRLYSRWIGSTGAPPPAIRTTPSGRPLTSTDVLRFVVVPSPSEP